MQHSLALSILVAAITIAVIFMKFRRELDFSISLNAAKHPWTLLWLGIGISISLALATAWYVSWFMSHYGLSLLPSAAFTGVIVGIFIAVIVPDVEGVRRSVHRVSAYLGAVCMPIFLLSVLANLSGIFL